MNEVGCQNLKDGSTKWEGTMQRQSYSSTDTEAEVEALHGGLLIQIINLVNIGACKRKKISRTI